MLLKVSVGRAFASVRWKKSTMRLEKSQEGKHGLFLNMASLKLFRGSVRHLGGGENRQHMPTNKWFQPNRFYSGKKWKDNDTQSKAVRGAVRPCLFTFQSHTLLRGNLFVSKWDFYHVQTHCSGQGFCFSPPALARLKHLRLPKLSEAFTASKSVATVHGDPRSGGSAARPLLAVHS